MEGWGGVGLLWREEKKKGRGWRGLFFRVFFFYSRGQISRHSGGREAEREVGGQLAEEREGSVQMDCLPRAAAPLACFTSPRSAALVSSAYMGEQSGESSSSKKTLVVHTDTLS